MSHLLDTNVLSGMLRGLPRIQMHVRRHSPQALMTSAVAMHELWFGAFKAPNQGDLLRRVSRIPIAVLPLDEDDARCAAEIRAELSRAGTPIGPYDLLIAGQARARSLTLVTHNTREFSRIPGLLVEDWEA